MHIGLKGLMATLYIEDLGAKTHRGLHGRLAPGLSAGGRTFGYRSVPVPDDIAAGAKRGQPARLESNPAEAAIVRRIFEEYAAGCSIKTIAHSLNADHVSFPAKDTKCGPARLGWAVSTIQVMLQNSKYVGEWTWDRPHFLKDPETGRRRPVERPAHEWVKQNRTDLRIIEPRLCGRRCRADSLTSGRRSAAARAHHAAAPARCTQSTCSRAAPVPCLRRPDGGLRVTLVRVA